MLLLSGSLNSSIRGKLLMRRKCLSLSIINVLACATNFYPASAHNADFHMAPIKPPPTHSAFTPILHNLHSMPLVSVSHSVRQFESAEMFVSHHGVNQMESPALLEARRRVMDLQAELLAARQRAMGSELFKGIGVGTVATTEVERLTRLHNEQNFEARISYAKGRVDQLVRALAARAGRKKGIDPQDIRDINNEIGSRTAERVLLELAEKQSLMRIQEAIQRERGLQGMVQKKLVDFFTRHPGATATNKI
jgi:hypothetical protein